MALKGIIFPSFDRMNTSSCREGVTRTFPSWAICIAPSPRTQYCLPSLLTSMRYLCGGNLNIRTRIFSVPKKDFFLYPIFWRILFVPKEDSFLSWFLDHHLLSHPPLHHLNPDPPHWCELVRTMHSREQGKGIGYKKILFGYRKNYA